MFRSGGSPTGQDGCYHIDRPAQWLQTLAPYLRVLVQTLKYAAPLAGHAIVRIVPADAASRLAQDIELMNDLVSRLPEIEDPTTLGLVETVGEGPAARQIEGAELRVLRQLLDEVDPRQLWGGLQLKLTSEGHYLWLCAEHAARY